MITIEAGGGQFDPTPEELHERDLAEWKALLAAYEVEQEGVAQRVGQLEHQLVGIEQSITSATGHDQAVFQIERVHITERLEHCKARLPAIAHAITAHRKAKP